MTHQRTVEQCITALSRNEARERPRRIATGSRKAINAQLGSPRARRSAPLCGTAGDLAGSEPVGLRTGFEDVGVEGGR
jgi:hypothetical protein